MVESRSGMLALAKLFKAWAVTKMVSGMGNLMKIRDFGAQDVSALTVWMLRILLHFSLVNPSDWRAPILLEMPAGRLGVVSPCERSETRGGVGERGCSHRGLKIQNLLVIRAGQMEVLHLLVPLGNSGTVPRGQRLESPLVRSWAGLQWKGFGLRFVFNARMFLAGLWWKRCFSKKSAMYMLLRTWATGHFGRVL